MGRNGAEPDGRGTAGTMARRSGTTTGMVGATVRPSRAAAARHGAHDGAAAAGRPPRGTQGATARPGRYHSTGQNSTLMNAPTSSNPTRRYAARAAALKSLT